MLLVPFDSYLRLFLRVLRECPLRVFLHLAMTVVQILNNDHPEKPLIQLPLKVKKVYYLESIVNGIKTAIAGIHYVFTYSRPYSVLPYPKVGEPNVHQDMKNLRRWNKAPYQPAEATCSYGCCKICRITIPSIRLHQLQREDHWRNLQLTGSIMIWISLSGTEVGWECRRNLDSMDYSRFMRRSSSD